jgi:FkbM family methyltransferase
MSGAFSVAVSTVNLCLRNTFGVEVKRARGDRHNRELWLRSLGIQSVIDVGANTGQFATFIASLFPDATIYSFEPLPDCIAQLDLLRAQGYKIRVFPYACGAADSTAIFHRSMFSPSSSMLPMARRHKELFPFTAGGTTTQVEVRRLDELMQEETLTCPLLVKLDVQGYEDRVIQGAGKTLSRATAVLTEVNFEPLYTHQADFDLTYRALVACGFEFRGMWDHTLDETTGLPVFGDALFTRRQPSL